MGVYRACVVALCGLSAASSGCITEGRVLGYADVTSHGDPSLGDTTISTDAGGLSEGSTFSETTSASGPTLTSEASLTTAPSSTQSDETSSTTGTRTTDTDSIASTEGTGGATEETSAGETGPDECEVGRGGELTLIDDLDDGDRAIVAQDGRRGWWYMGNDETNGEQFPAGEWAPTDADAHSGEFSARSYGGGFTAWGATLSLTLNAECPYDASTFSGIEFWARGIGPVRVRFTTVATVPTDLDPGMCVEECWDDYGTEITLTDAWEHYAITWDELSQQGWGEPVDFDPATLLAIVWHDLDASGELDIWVDDVHFLLTQD